MAGVAEAASLLIRLFADPSGIEEGVKKAEGSLGGLGGNVKKAFGAAVTGAFGLATIGAAEAENAMARFRAETGATVEEATRMYESLNSLAGRTTASFQTISETAIRVRTDIGLTGDAAVVFTEKMVQFQIATRQGADAVLALDDILDAWNLEADAAAGVMDILIVSHQKYGGSIEDNQRVLAQLAPALQAANMSIEEGQGLLNLFARSGVGGEAATTAFNRALSKVESPEELRKLLENISSQEDAFKRAQLAAELFGARAGSKIAQALSDADGDLGAFIVTMEEAAGATTEASDAIEGTFGATVQKVINGARAAFRGFGMEIGPVATGLAGIVTLGQTLGVGKFFPTDKLAGIAKTGIKSIWRNVLPVAVMAAAEVGAAQGVAMVGAENAAGMLGSIKSGLKRVNWKGLVAGAGLAIGGAIVTDMTKGMGAVESSLGGAAGAAMMIGGAFAAGGYVAAGITAVILLVQQLHTFLNQVAGAQADLAAKASAAADQSAQDAIKNLGNLTTKLNEMQGLDRVLGDTFGGKEMAEGLRNLGSAIVNAKTLTVAEATQAIDVLNKAIVEAEARGNKEIADELRGYVTTVEGYQQQAAQATDGVYRAIEDAANEGGAAAASAVGKSGAEIVSEFRKEGRRLRSSMAETASTTSSAWGAITDAMSKGPELKTFRERMKEAGEAIRQNARMLAKAIRMGDTVGAAEYANRLTQARAARAELKKNAEGTLTDAAAILGRHQGMARRKHKGMTKDVQREAKRAARIALREGRAAAEALPDELEASKPDAAAAAGEATTAVQSEMAWLVPQATTYGSHLGSNYAAGIRSAIPAVQSASMSLAQAASQYIKMSAPPKKGALSTIKTWGPHLVDNWVGPMEKHANRAAAAGMLLAASVASGMGDGPEARFARPEIAARAFERGGPIYNRPGAGGSMTINVGTLIANDAGLDELKRRMEKRMRMTMRDRRYVGDEG